MAQRCLFISAALCAPAAPQSLITTVAGADYVFQGDAQPALNAPMGQVAGVTIDPARNIYFVDIE